MIIKLETDLGEVELFFDVQNAPLTAKYFEELVVEGSLDMTSFFRIVSQDSQSSQQGSPIEVLQCGIWKESQEELTKIEHESTNLTAQTSQMESIYGQIWYRNCLWQFFYLYER